MATDRDLSPIRLAPDQPSVENHQGYQQEISNEGNKINSRTSSVCRR